MENLLFGQHGRNHVERQSRADIFGAVGSGKYDGYVMIAAFGIFAWIGGLMDR